MSQYIKNNIRKLPSSYSGFINQNRIVKHWRIEEKQKALNSNKYTAYKKLVQERSNNIIRYTKKIIREEMDIMALKIRVISI